MERSNEPEGNRCCFADCPRTGVRTGSKSESGESEQGCAGGVPNWDVSASCRAAGKVSYAQQAGENGKILYGEKTREKLAADWSTFPVEERTRCIKSIEWFSPTYTELVACLEMHGQVRNIRGNDAATPNKPQR